MTFARKIACALAGVFLLLACGAASPARADDISVTDVWARATPAGAKMGAIYLTLESAAGDQLLGAAVPRSVAGKTQVHETVIVPERGGPDSAAGGAGRMAMREVKSIALPPGQAVQLAPGGYHVMLLDLKHPLMEGARVPLTLRFEKAGKRSVVAIVRVG